MLLQSCLSEITLFGGIMRNCRWPFSAKALRAAVVTVLAVLIVAAQFALAAPAMAASQPPEQAALQFYRWYMQSLAINQDPLKQSPVQMSAYVEKGLMKELTRRMSRKGLHADYFIQAQEFMDDWPTHIKVVRPTVQGNVASVVVLLGATPDTRRILALTMFREQGDWKISMVRLV
jgi:hypothetical protein